MARGSKSSSLSNRTSAVEGAEVTTSAGLIKASVGTALGGASVIAIAGFAHLSVHGALPREHSFYAVIGRVTAEWSQIEHALDLIIWKMLDVPDPLGSCITGILIGHTPRFLLINTVGRYRGLPKTILDQVETMGGKTSELAKERNRIVHDPWYMEQRSGTIAQFKSITVKNKKFGLQDIDPDEAERIISKIQQKVTQIVALGDRILKILKP